MWELLAFCVATVLLALQFTVLRRQSEMTERLERWLPEWGRQLAEVRRLLEEGARRAQASGTATRAEHVRAQCRRSGDAGSAVWCRLSRTGSARAPADSERASRARIGQSLARRGEYGRGPFAGAGPTGAPANSAPSAAAAQSV